MADANIERIRGELREILRRDPFTPADQREADFLERDLARLENIPAGK